MNTHDESYDSSALYTSSLRLETTNYFFIIIAHAIQINYC